LFSKEATMTSNQRTDRPQRAYLTHDGPLFFAHRGGSALVPENTLVAYEKGLSYGADGLELDVHPTRDGEIVVIHDDTLDRTTDGSGRVTGFTLDDLRKFDAGYRFTPDAGASYPYRGRGITIPTLAEVFERFPAARVNIEMKEDISGIEERLLSVIQAARAEHRALVASFLTAPLTRFRAIGRGRVATSASMTEIRAFIMAAYARATRLLRPAYDALQVPETYRGVPVVTPTTVRAAHQLGLAVHVWTVDDRASMERLLGYGVDGLMSDRPDVLAQTLAAWRLAHVVS
jgi:glycerophosphoryl diester phosphodiesterase